MSFEDILGKKSADVKQMPPTPSGTYLAMVTGQPKQSAVGNDKTPVFDYDLKLVQPQDDVNAEELETAGGLGGLSLLRARFFITEKAAYRLKDFLTACGVEEGDMTLGQRMALAAGHQVKVLVEQTPSQDGQTMYANAKSYSVA